MSSVDLSNIIDVKHALAGDEDAMREVRKYAFMEDITYDEAVRRMVNMIKEYDLHMSSPFCKKILQSKDEKIVPFNVTELSSLEKCFSFSKGPASLQLCISFNPTTLTITVDAKLVVSKITVLDKQIGTLSIGQTTTVNGSIGIAKATLSVKFDKNSSNQYQVTLTLSGKVGVGIFSKSFGPWTHTFTLPFSALLVSKSGTALPFGEDVDDSKTSKVDKAVTTAAVVMPQTASGGIDMGPYEGKKIQGNLVGVVYVCMGLKLRGIPNPSTYNGLFTQPWQITTLEQAIVDLMPKGKNIPNGSQLIGNGIKTFMVDVNDNNQVVKRWITSPSVMSKYGFNSGVVVRLTELTCSGIPNGDDISA